jgi:hypothetical protein
MKELEQEEKPNNDESIKKKKPKVNYLFNHTYAKGIKKVKKYVDGQMINIELFEDDETLAVEIKEKAEQYYDEYGTLEDALSEFEDEDEKELANQHLKSAYGI